MGAEWTLEMLDATHDPDQPPFDYPCGCREYLKEDWAVYVRTCEQCRKTFSYYGTDKMARYTRIHLLRMAIGIWGYSHDDRYLFADGKEHDELQPVKA